MICDVLCTTVVHNDTHTNVSSSYIFACWLDLDFVLCVYFVFFSFVCCFMIA